MIQMRYLIFHTSLNLIYFLWNSKLKTLTNEDESEGECDGEQRYKLYRKHQIITKINTCQMWT